MTAKPPAGLEESDFETIEEAVMETARGRWFLIEYARRARADDTARLLEAVARLEALMRGQSRDFEPGVGAEQHARALEERHERLAEIAWMLRERGYDGDVCALIEREARAIGRVAADLRGGVEPRLRERSAMLEQTPARVLEAPEPVAAPPLPIDHAPPPQPPAPSLPDWRETTRRALAPIDRMTPREKLAFFA